ncbi:MAG: peroxiredoxin [Chloroflexota bacterium]
MPAVGEMAPDFALPNQDGDTVRLSDLRGQKVILFAFPKADTPGCTAQACGFRDSFPRIETANAVVLGISADTQADLKAWKQKENLPYDLLSDTDHQVLDTYEAWGELSFKGRTFEATMRSFWVIDEEGCVIAGQVRVTPDESVLQALAAVSI